MMAKNICSKCGGKIVAEAFGSYGTVYYIRKNGETGHKIREIKYDHTGDWMYYCTECGENYEQKDIKGKANA